MVHDVHGTDIHEGYNTYSSRSGITIVPWETVSLNGTEIFIVLSQRKEHDRYIFQSRYNGLFELNTEQYTLVDAIVRPNVFCNDWYNEHDLNRFAPQWFASFKSLTRS